MIRRLLPLLAVLLSLAACGDLPEPFLGNPGATARRLARPPTPVLAIPPPADAMLTDAAGQAMAENLASALLAREVPAIARPKQRTDWSLDMRVQREGDAIVAHYTVHDPDGGVQGETEGPPVKLREWAAADPTTLREAAAAAAPNIADALTAIRIARDKADPNSLYNRPARVMVAEVTGAPGDGNYTLTKQMRTRLALLGPQVQTTESGADFIVRGEVKAVPIANRQQRIEIQWIISTAGGDERGRVIQLNEIPAGTLDRYWGDVAVVVTTEASNGVNNVLQRQAKPDPPPPQVSAKP